MRIQYGDETASKYSRERQLEARFTSHKIGMHYHSGSLNPAHTEALPVEARSDVLGVHCDHSDAPTQLTSYESQNEMRFGQAAMYWLSTRQCRSTQSASPEHSSGSQDLPLKGKLSNIQGMFSPFIAHHIHSNTRFSSC